MGTIELGLGHPHQPGDADVLELIIPQYHLANTLETETYILVGLDDA